jgi:hypothetical protein
MVPFLFINIDKLPIITMGYNCFKGESNVRLFNKKQFKR